MCGGQRHALPFAAGRGCAGTRTQCCTAQPAGPQKEGPVCPKCAQDAQELTDCCCRTAAVVIFLPFPSRWTKVLCRRLGPVQLGPSARPPRRRKRAAKLDRCARPHQDEAALQCPWVPLGAKGANLDGAVSRQRLAQCSRPTHSVSAGRPWAVWGRKGGPKVAPKEENSWPLLPLCPFVYTKQLHHFSLPLGCLSLCCAVARDEWPLFGAPHSSASAQNGKSPVANRERERPIWRQVTGKRASGRETGFHSELLFS